MRKVYHKSISVTALGSLFSRVALAHVIKANVYQDALQYCIGYDHFHFDNNAISSSQEYMTSQRELALVSLRKMDVTNARSAFGRLLHTAQDFYAHTNYIALLKDQDKVISDENIDPLDAGILSSASLQSGKIYYREIFTLIPFIGNFFWYMMPMDSHAKMNIDGPERGNFELVYAASVKRTLYEFNLISDQLTNEKLKMFTGRS